MKKILLFFITLLFIPRVYALTVEDVEITSYANDYSNILSNELESYIIEHSEKLNNADGTQIVVVTIPTLDGNSLEDFSYDLANYYKIGHDSKGLLILLVTEDRKVRVEVGDNLEGILNDAKVGRYIDEYMIPYLSNDDWENGIRNGYNAFFNEIVTTNNLDLDTTSVVSNQYNGSSDDEDVFIALMFSLMVAFIGGAIGNGIRKIYFGDYICFPLLLSPLFVGIKNEYELTVSLIMCIFPLMLYLILRLSSGTSHGGSSWSSGGSSWSGGSSGGFSGGGGHFSGGGASRGF